MRGNEEGFENVWMASSKMFLASVASSEIASRLKILPILIADSGDSVRGYNIQPPMVVSDL